MKDTDRKLALLCRNNFGALHLCGS
jgi:hypothetical protein